MDINPEIVPTWISPEQIDAVTDIYLIVCPKTRSKGTGFFYKSGHIITNEHVVRGSLLGDIFAINYKGERINFTKVGVDVYRDLAFLTPKEALQGGLEIDTTSPLLLYGTEVTTWGHPLGYNGPLPILSVGNLAGTVNRINVNPKTVKHIIVNGAFNQGNSGGPLFIANGHKVIGVVVAKHGSLSEFSDNAITALSQNASGVIYTATDEFGNQHNLSESQLLAKILKDFQSLSQVMIGEAIDRTEVISFLREQGIE